MDTTIALTTARTELARCLSQSAETRDDGAITDATQRWFAAIATHLADAPDTCDQWLRLCEAFALHDTITILSQRRAA